MGRLSAFPRIKARASGGVDVIDTVSLQNVKTIAIEGGVHDLNVTPDGKFLIAGASRGAKPPANLMAVIDTKTNDIAWTLPMSPVAVTDGDIDQPRRLHQVDLRPARRNSTASR